MCQEIYHTLLKVLTFRCFWFPSGFYIYIDGSDSTLNQRAKLVSSTYHLAGIGCKFNLYYYMFGPTYGDITISVRYDNKEKILSQLSNDIGPYNRWNMQSTTMPNCLTDFQVHILPRIVDVNNNIPIRPRFHHSWLNYKVICFSQESHWKLLMLETFDLKYLVHLSHYFILD